jgi:N6-L-threonylcarbamoyladenine synthase
MNYTILAIESSCDETSAAVLVNGKIHSNIVATQTVHQKYGGVVPELASRAHQQHIIPVVSQALAQAKIAKNQLDAVAFTRGPGLLGALLVGSSFAKSLAMGLGISLIDVNHMQAHILAHFIDDPKPAFPFLCLTVSGGHTQIVKVKDYLDMEIIGETQDDAVGEAFDKTAKLLDLPYPGGPLIDTYAQEGNPKAFTFPQVDMPGLDFSFSGIKTAFLYFLRDHTARDANFIKNNLADICARYSAYAGKYLTKKITESSQRNRYP